jgi:hypothetical protein
MERMVEPTYLRLIHRTVMVHYQLHTACLHLVVYNHSSLHNTQVRRLNHTSHDLSPTILTLKWLRMEHSHSLKMTLFRRNM